MVQLHSNHFNLQTTGATLRNPSGYATIGRSPPVALTLPRNRLSLRSVDTTHIHSHGIGTPSGAPLTSPFDYCRRRRQRVDSNDSGHGESPRNSNVPNELDNIQVTNYNRVVMNKRTRACEHHFGGR